MKLPPDLKIIQSFPSEYLSAKSNIHEFLDQFGQEPALVFFKGQEKGQTPRVITTLLHGNEPSGVFALQRLIEQRTVPVVDTYFIIPSIKVATTEPWFHYRFLPETRDLNRCFADKEIVDDLSKLALEIRSIIEFLKPELVMDVHNTSSESPAFNVARTRDKACGALCQLFSPYIVHSTIEVGALFEQDFGCPNVTIECGGGRSQVAHEIAYSGLHRLFRTPLNEILAEEGNPVWLPNPIRLELKPDTKLAYSDQPCPGADLTLPKDIDNFNFVIWEPDRPLGWLGERGMTIFNARCPQGENRLKELFINRNNQLYPSQPLHLFMITTRADIALSDCLLYAVVEGAN